MLESFRKFIIPISVFLLVITIFMATAGQLLKDTYTPTPVATNSAAQVLSNNTGILVGEIPEGTPAHKAGLKSGDVIRSVNGTNVNNPEQFMEAVKDIKPESTLSLVIMRDGEEKTIHMSIDKA